MATLTSFEVAELLLDCAYNALDHDGELEIKRRCVVPGEIAWDECECGQLVVAEQRRFPSNDFPLEEVDHTAECGSPWLCVVYAVSLARCVPGVSINGVAPTCVALQASGAQLSRDMGIMRNAIECCLDTAYSSDAVRAYELGAQEVQGPQGNCIETNLLVMVGFVNGCGCG